jgi:hypothetical protein
MYREHAYSVGTPVGDIIDRVSTVVAFTTCREAVTIGTPEPFPAI